MQRPTNRVPPKNTQFLRKGSTRIAQASKSQPNASPAPRHGRWWGTPTSPSTRAFPASSTGGGGGASPFDSSPLLIEGNGSPIIPSTRHGQSVTFFSITSCLACSLISSPRPPTAMNLPTPTTPPTPPPRRPTPDGPDVHRHGVHIGRRARLGGGLPGSSPCFVPMSSNWKLCAVTTAAERGT